MTELQIAAFLDGGLAMAERERVEDHLTECPECRANVAASASLVRQVRRPRKILAATGIMLAAAAALFIVRPHTESTLVRRGMESDSDSLIVFSPVTARTQTPAKFVWSSAKGAASYELKVSDPDGSTVWTYSGNDTVAVMPDSVPGLQSKRYVWIADALMEDGTRRSTGLHEVKITRTPTH